MDQPANAANRLNGGPIRPELGQRPALAGNGCYVQHMMLVPPCVNTDEHHRVT